MKNKNLKQARLEKKLNQEQLAKLVGVKGKASISNWENGHSTPTVETAIRLSRVLNKDVEFLFGHNVQVSHTNKVAN